MWASQPSSLPKSFVLAACCWCCWCCCCCLPAACLLCLPINNKHVHTHFSHTHTHTDTRTHSYLICLNKYQTHKVNDFILGQQHYLISPRVGNKRPSAASWGFSTQTKPPPPTSSPAANDTVCTIWTVYCVLTPARKAKANPKQRQSTSAL